MVSSVDYVIVAVYLFSTALVGAYFSRRNTTTEAYFLGSRGLPGWAVGISILSTSVSSITFLAFPATSFILDLRLYPKDFMFPLVALLAMYWIAPAYRRLPGCVSAFEILEHNFGSGVRVYGAVCYVLMTLLKLSTVLYLLSLPVSLLLDGDRLVVIAATGIFVASYSMVGGISAVIFTDVVQALVLLLGGCLAIFTVATNLDGGFSEIIISGSRGGKFSLGSPEWSLESRTLPTVLLYGLLHYLGRMLGFQDTVQRYLCAQSLAQARKAVLVSAVMSVPTWGLFYFVGICLFVFYQKHPDRLPGGIEPDAVFPQFILAEMPRGAAGVVISGVLAAAMSTMDSSLNAISSVVVTDVCRRFLFKLRGDQFYLQLGRWTSVMSAVLMILGAFLIDAVPKESINDANNVIGGVLAGASTAIFSLALLRETTSSLLTTQSASARSGGDIVLTGGGAGYSFRQKGVPRRFWFPREWCALCGVGGSSLCALWLSLAHVQRLPAWLNPPLTRTLHPYWIQLVANLAFLVVAYMCEFAVRGCGRRDDTAHLGRYHKFSSTSQGALKQDQGMQTQSRLAVSVREDDNNPLIPGEIELAEGVFVLEEEEDFVSDPEESPNIQ